MRRHSSILVAVGVLLAISAGGAMADHHFAGPGPGVTGNDTGGIFPYSPDVEKIYQQIAADYCAKWHRLSHVTSVHRKYGDYVSFVCIDKPWMIH
jgi:hypothetical protein